MKKCKDFKNVIAAFYAEYYPTTEILLRKVEIDITIFESYFTRINTVYIFLMKAKLITTFYSFTATQSRYTIIDNGGESILRIEPVRAGRDDAPYECVAENGVGDAVSAEATLTVYEGKSSV